ncbi:Ankyrin repeat [Macleaya cordata]|uniref:Ankyrin repeat n=1 Tax=Macleaya cordata TaxID=56857 RepID=A0A200RAQ4_MACCD|nr:Ankyrin repeat [Macleaya cordata]
MDQRLFTAAQTGNLEAFYEQLAEDPLVLERVSLGSCSETPLHIAALAGQTDFAKEIIRRRPAFAVELNKDGFSPIHMASANGYVEIVKELLTQVGSSLCVLKDAEGRTPLHCAVTKGRINVIHELLSACSGCVREVTARSETALHLAVKNNQFEVLKGLLESCHTNDELLNAKDRDGNTISCEPQDIEIKEILRLAGAQSSQDISTTQQVVVKPATPVTSEEVLIPVHQDHISISVRQEPNTSRAIKLFKDFSKEIVGEIENSPRETRNALLVVAVLIATLTYQGGLNPPGGVWQDHSPGNNSTTTTAVVVGNSIIHHAGKAIMAYQHQCFIYYMVFNTLGFFTSLVLISFLTSRFPLKAWLQLAVISMAIAFGCGVCFIASFRGCLKVFLQLFFFGAVLGWYHWWIIKFAHRTLRRLCNYWKYQNLFQRIIQFILSHSRSINNAVQVDQL